MPTDFPGYEDDDPAASCSENPGLGEPTLLDEIVEDTADPNRIVTKAPAEHFRLGLLDVACLVINRMIGTGIFNSPQTVMRGTRSTAISLFFWFFGICYGLAGAHVYTEFGLNVPRYVVDGTEQSVPRSGGDMHYLQYIFRRPRYKKDTVVLMGCLFGISFICIGNMAGNSIICALRLLQAANPGVPVESFSNGEIRGIAIVIAVLACFIHTVSRRGGILLNNIFALIKVGILLLIIATACAVSRGGLHKAADGTTVPDVFAANTGPDVAFAHRSLEGNGYASAFLSIIFAFSGFDQPNYVLGEIRRPRRTFPLAMFIGVGTVGILYMAVNLCYMVVVREDDQIKANVAQQFFNQTFGVLDSDSRNHTAERVLNAFLAISSLGNIIVMTYTAARMKQEIAKQGFLPWPKFFASNKDYSLGRFLRWLERSWPRASKIMFLSPEQHTERTPVGALLLHFLSCLVLIFATYKLPAENAYYVLSSTVAYLFPSWFGFFLALGILVLRFRGPPVTDPVATRHHPGSRGQGRVEATWATMTKGTVNPYVSVAAATIYLLGNAYPIIASWIPSTQLDLAVSWFVVPVIGWAVLGVASLWFVGFLGRAALRARRRNETFVLKRFPEFEWADGGNSHDGEGGGESMPKTGGLVLAHETVIFSWEGAEMEHLEQLADLATKGRPYETRRTMSPADEFAGTDFGNLRD